MNADSIYKDAAWVYANLRDHGSAILNYEPGNATRYTLTFLRVSRVDEIDGCSVDGVYVMVGYLGHGCYPFELLNGYKVKHIDPGYIMEKLGSRFGGDGDALAALFDQIIALDAFQ